MSHLRVKDQENVATLRNGDNEFGGLQKQWAQASAKSTVKPMAVQKQDLLRTDPRHKQKEKRFRSAHSWLTLLLFWLVSLQIIGLYFFTKGFLLTKLVLDYKSECAESPLGSNLYQAGDSNAGCWHPKAFEKAVVIVIDALRYDFTIPTAESPAPYQNSLKVLYETAFEHPSNAFLLPFIADPPTTTLQRLKGLTTGTLPTFIDAGSNFAGTEIDEDNIVAQLRAAGKKISHLGDDTWTSLFPKLFEPEISHPYESFNVWDLHTLDNGVTEHLFPLLHPSNSTKWDVIFGHYLGVDHAGHRYGPSHSAMTAKLEQMDRLIRQMIDAIDDSTLLVVMGDHGMDAKGDHGGESDDEVQAALWMYSKIPRFGRTSPEFLKPPPNAKEHVVGQIDLVPTLSLLLGIPIPFNNLGAPIEEAFMGSSGKDWQNLARANYLTAAQIRRYQGKYAEARNMDEKYTVALKEAWEDSQNAWDKLAKKPTKAQWESLFRSANGFQKFNLEICKSLWARFDIPSMIQGILILLWTTIIVSIFARSSNSSRSQLPYDLLKKAAPGAVIGGFGGILPVVTGLSSEVLNVVLFGIAIGSLLGLTLASIAFANYPLPTSVWGWVALIVTVSQAGGFAANSFTIWEDEILLFFIASVGLLTFIASVRQKSYNRRIHGMTQAASFVFMTRLASLSRLCREEQMPYCKSTFYGASSSSTSSAYLLLIPVFIAYALPKSLITYFKVAGSEKGTASIVVSMVCQGGLVLSALFWILDTAADNDVLPLSEGVSKDIRMTLARIILFGALGPGVFVLFVQAEPCVTYLDSTKSETSADAPTSSSTNQNQPTYIFGSFGARGAHYLILVAVTAIVAIFLQKPMGGGAMAIFAMQILALIEVFDVNNLASSSIGPILIAMLGNFHFFKTGHQATLPSIQWETAFVATKTVVYPWSPLFVVINTFGPQIFAALAVPLIALWRQWPKKRGLLGLVTKAMATFMLYHTVISLATTLWAYWLRRHLMLYRIFSPRFLTASLVLVVTDLIAVVFVSPALRCNFSKIGRLFGYMEES